MDSIIKFALRIILLLAGIDYEAWKESRDSGAAKSAVESKEQEAEAEKAARAASEKAKQGGSDDDVFGIKND